MKDSYTSHPFAFPGTPHRYARDRVADFHQICLELEVDLGEKTLQGTARHHFQSLRDGLGRLVLDAAEMKVAAVRFGGEETGWAYDGERLTVEFPSTLNRGDAGEVEVDYSVRDPRLGFYFIGPDEGYPDRPVHGWSQGQDEDSRYWWPCFDYPNERAATEMIVTVPGGCYALSNGALLSRDALDDGRERFHWKQEASHVAYLVTLAVGRFSELPDEASLTDGKIVPLQTYVLPGREEEGERAVKGTPEMVRLFSEKTGVPYPWEKYAQVFVSEFVFGGMENTSATTMTDELLRDERAALDTSSEDIVAHELAHQWFGDLVTCRDWSQAWLNEGFATFMEVVWRENKHGIEEGWWHLANLADSYRDEARDRYVRPIVCRTYDEPIDLFDAHLYLKGAWVLNALRARLGEEDFWSSVQKYLETNRARGIVEVDDLRRAVEVVTGRNLEGFFDQWVKGAGIPSLKLSASWNAEDSRLDIVVRQTQSGDGVPEVFDLPVEFAVSVNGNWQTHETRICQKERTLSLGLSGPPEAVAFEPRWTFLHDQSFDRPIGWLTHQLQQGPTAASRVDAAASLSGNGASQAIAALAACLENEEENWRVRAEAAESLGKIAGSESRDLLIKCRSVKHPKARRAVVRALGNHPDENACKALAELFRAGDPSYMVEAAAARAAGSTRATPAFALLKEALDRDSWNEVVRAGALDGLATLGDPRGIDLALAWTEYGRPPRARTAAAGALGQMGWAEAPQRRKIRLRLQELAHDPNFRVNVAAVAALGELGDPEASGVLRRLSDSASDGRVRRVALESLRAVGEEGGAAKQVRTLRGALEEARRSIADLTRRLERLEKAAEDPKA